MSEIFYTQVDKNLATELDARALAGRVRDNKSIDYMVGKIANVKIIAYEGNGSTDKELFTLGGEIVRGPSFQPSGPEGFLSENATRTFKELSWVTEGTGDKATLIPIPKETVRQNSNNRIPPYISSANISVGDHAMGLLNTATFVIEVSNPERDLDFIEQVFFRPGRYVKMQIEYPPSAIITGLNLSPVVIPNADKLKAQYGEKINIDKVQQELARMNTVSFEGLITSFTFDYLKDYTVQATISMRGTSGIYPDISLMINSITTEQNGANATSTPNPIADPDKYNATIDSKTTEANKQDNTSFYAQLYDNVQAQYKANSKDNTLINQLEGVDDIWYLIGNAWPQKEKTDETAEKTFSRYITLGFLIDFINKTLVPKVKDAVPYPVIVCSSNICYSNYYEYISSADPQNILLLPKDTNRGTTEKYGSKIYFETVKNDKWQGYQGKEVAYPARIFLNLNMIKEIFEELSESGDTFKVSDFLKEISVRIENATGKAVSMNLVTHPKDFSILLFYDNNFLGTPSETDDVKPYHVPMTAAYPTDVIYGSLGSIVHDFKLSSKLPDSVSTLSYVLNQNPSEISEDQIAPYMNYMYNSNDPEKIEKANTEYQKRYTKFLNNYNKTREDFGNNITDTTIQTLFNEALKKYIQNPTDAITKSQQITAPIFPIEAEFTIDGISGFRYGDVVTFDILPFQYRINTVFSIIGIEHDVTQDGQWITRCRCIMRPRIGK